MKRKTYYFSSFRRASDFFSRLHYDYDTGGTRICSVGIHIVAAGENSPLLVARGFRPLSLCPQRPLVFF